MKLKNLTCKILPIIFCFLVFLGPKKSFCEEQDKSKDKKDASTASFEQALKNYDAHKQKEQQELAGKLNFSLGRTIEDWINSAENNKRSKLNTYLDLEWDKLELFYTVPPVRYEYYLRGYKYSVIKNDITKTDALTYPYRAVVIIKEELYVEKNHPSNISDANPYFYTVATNYTLNLEYKNEVFTVANSENKIISMENRCPDEIKKLRL